MPIFQDFAQNGEFLQMREEALNPENFARYVKENGLEKAQGYLEALADFTKQLDKILLIRGKETYNYHTPPTIKRESLKLLEEKEELLEFAHGFIEKYDSEKGVTSTPSPKNE